MLPERGLGEDGGFAVPELGEQLERGDVDRAVAQVTRQAGHFEIEPGQVSVGLCACDACLHAQSPGAPSLAFGSEMVGSFLRRRYTTSVLPITCATTERVRSSTSRAIASVSGSSPAIRT